MQGGWWEGVGDVLGKFVENPYPAASGPKLSSVSSNYILRVLKL